MNYDAVSFIVLAIEPAIKQMHQKFSRLLGWELEDFIQEAYVKVCEPAVLPEQAGPVLSYFAKTYRNHVLDSVRKVRSQDKILANYLHTKDYVPSFYDDTNVIELSYVIQNELPSVCRDIVVALLNGRTQRQIMSEIPSVSNNYAYYKALAKIRREVERFYVLEKG